MGVVLALRSVFTPNLSEMDSGRERRSAKNSKRFGVIINAPTEIGCDLNECMIGK